MTRIRRMRWIIVTALAATVVATLAVGARAMAQEGGSARCAPPAASASAAGPVRQPSWRAGALRVMGCHAWHRMHNNNHRTLIRVSR